jgi:pimeloyl-ACP methyl ester carboxylesterase
MSASGGISLTSGLIALAAAAAGSLWLTPVEHPHLEYPKRQRGAARRVLGLEHGGVAPAHVAALGRAFAGQVPDSGGENGARWLQGRHGVTHFQVHGEDNLDRLIVLAHGLGTNMHLYDEFLEPLVQSGFAVLVYDYFNHGWSVAKDKFLVYDQDVIVEQLEDLLDHVLPTREMPLFGFVGHSTGGCLGVLADAHMERSIQNIFHVSPAIFAKKPLIAQLADAGLYKPLENLFLRRGLLQGLVSDAYTENGELAWARDEATSKYLFHGTREAHEADNVVMFEHHPFIHGGIWGLNSYILRQDLLPAYVVSLSKTETRTMVVWGKLDVVVPYTKENVAATSVNPGVTVVGLDGLGHESLSEDSAAVLKPMLEFFQSA